VGETRRYAAEYRRLVHERVDDLVIALAMGVPAHTARRPLRR